MNIIETQYNATKKRENQDLQRERIGTITIASRTDTGQVRSNNEDALVVCEPPISHLGALLGKLAVLCDGAGGHAAGEVASGIAIETIARTYYQEQVPPDPSEKALQLGGIVTHLDGIPEELDLPLAHLRSAFVAAHTQIYQQSCQVPGFAGMATTCVAAVVKENWLLLAHVGDSRAYLLRTSPAGTLSLIYRTTDHSLANELARAGLLSPAAIPQSHQRHILTRMFGAQQKRCPAPDIMTARLQAGDTLVLCCDGLWSLVTEEQMIQVVRRNSPQQACDELIRLANSAGGNDNISVIIISLA
jgi:serine/threonine protein phosphatase PrpC